jgi:hypothetical protein
MKSQHTLSKEIAYLKGRIRAFKGRQRIDSSRAIMHLDTRPDDIIQHDTYTLAAGATVRISITYTHPDSPTPYAELQWFMVDHINVNYAEHREETSDLYVTKWTLALNNLAATSDTFSVYYGVKSSAPGTLTIQTV